MTQYRRFLPENTDLSEWLEKPASSSTGDELTVEQLALENQQLSRQLKAFVTKVRQNEEKLRKFQDLELSLISCTSLFELIYALIYDYRHLSKLDQVSLLLFDKDLELQSMLEEENVTFTDHPDLVFVQQDHPLALQLKQLDKPYVGSFIPERHAGFFPSHLTSIESVALLPMRHKGKIIGCMNLGSHKRERFIQGVATDFLQRLSLIAACCLSNVVDHERLRRLGLTDVLTGVNNRRFFDQRLFDEVHYAQRHDHSLCCVMFDIDHFKAINDTYGHKAGDSVLREVAAVIRTQLRSSDVLCRYGGEEFSALLVNTGREEAVEVAERIRQGIEDCYFSIGYGKSLSLTISIGVGVFDSKQFRGTTNDVANELVHVADLSLYRAKETGRNKVKWDALGGGAFIQQELALMME